MWKSYNLISLQTVGCFQYCLLREGNLKMAFLCHMKIKILTKCEMKMHDKQSEKEN